MNFEDFKLDDQVFEGLNSMGYKTPTNIQQLAIPVILQDKDLIACAQTGTGKTASYLLPALQQISKTDKKHIHTLILAPTRELAQQIDQLAEGLSYFAGITSIAVYGGGDGILYEQQRRAMMEGVDIVIATPGRLLAHLQSGAMNFSHLKQLVLDEADRMLDMGFFDDIMRVISYLPKKRQNLLFSATMPPKIRTMAKKILHQPEEINIAVSQPASGIDQQVYRVFDQQKIPLIHQLFKNNDFPSALIFASRKETVKQLYKELKKDGIHAEPFHSDLEQPERERIMRAFRARQLPIIIGTDVLSRGIDVEGISLVLNYDVPPDPEDYIHRIGRTARAERLGTAITFVNNADLRRLSSIERLMGREIKRMDLPESLGAAPQGNQVQHDGEKRRPFRKKKPGFRPKRNPNDHSSK